MQEQATIIEPPLWISLDYPHLPTSVLHTSVQVFHYIITFGGYSYNFSPDSKKNSENWDSSLEMSLENVNILNSHTLELHNIKANGTIPVTREGHSACLLGENQIIMFGGANFSKKEVLNDISVMSVSETGSFSLEWKPVKIKGQSISRYSHTAHVVGQFMFVFGGVDENKVLSNQLWRLDLNTERDSCTWTLCETTENSNKPEARYGHCSALCEDNIYVYGGIKSLQITSENFLNDLWVFEIASMNWRQLTPKGSIPGGRSGGSLIEMNKILFLYGGQTDRNDLDELFSYDIKNNIWQLIKATSNSPDQKSSPSPKSFHSSVCFENKIFFWGGEPEKRNAENSPKRSQGQCYKYQNIITIATFPNEKPNIIREVIENPATPTYKKLFDEKFFFDITFEVEGQEIQAHKSILAAGSKFFFNMFTSGMEESRATKIKFPEVSAKTFTAMLEFIYCGDIEVDEVLALELLELSDKYSLSDLNRKCEDFLCESVMEDNCILLCEAADLFGSSKLMEAVQKFMTENLEIIKEREEIFDLPKYVLTQLFRNLKTNSPEPRLGD